MTPSPPQEGTPAGTLGEIVARSDRLLLRYPIPEDRDAYLSARRDSRAELATWEPLPPEGQDFDDPRAFERVLLRTRSDRSRSILVFFAATGTLAGCVNINDIVLGAFRSAYLGYWISTPFTGKGLATESVSLAIPYAFGVLDLHRLEANIQPTNEASLAVARNCGFRREGFSPRYLRIAGEWADHERWALTREDQVPDSDARG